MKKQKEYPMTRFSPEVIREAKSILEIPLKQEKPSSLTVSLDGERWSHDSEDEFYADIRKDITNYLYLTSNKDYWMSISYFRPSCTVEVGAPTRSEVEHIFEIFEKGAPKCQVATSSLTVQEINAFKPVIFIGHGRSPIWRDLKDHLHEQHGYDVQAYEIGSRAGHAIRDILEDMLETSLFAILVMTAEDKIRSGHMRARQNVVHELGLFQGKLGFSKAIILLERGVQEFSNIHGIHQIRFSKKNIKETYGDVLATLRREFGQSQSENEDS